jgi:alkaline phosphatase
MLTSRFKSGILSVALFLSGSVLATAGNAVFIHPDGTGLGHWNAARYLYVGPDGMLNWDKLDRLAAYRPHQKNWLSTTSHAGATVHAYGRKVHEDSYGLDRDQPITALSGKPRSIMEEAMDAGIRVGIVNSGHIGEPGTGVFLASHGARNDKTAIAVKVLESGADLIFCGGETLMIPEGTVGKHGMEGTRTDKRNLLQEAEQNGYTVIYTREELHALDPATEKVIGVFSANNTYNDKSEAALRDQGLPTYNPDEATFPEMVAAALKILGSDPDTSFFLVAEEEGTDNFSNKMNAMGMLDAMERADAAIGEVLSFMQSQPDRPTLLLVGADSDAGSPTIVAPKYPPADYRLPETSSSGAELDGPEGQGGLPFMSKPDAFGNSYPFGIAWADGGDTPGSVVAKAHGYRSELLTSTVDNTGIYKILYEALFEKAP